MDKIWTVKFNYPLADSVALDQYILVTDILGKVVPVDVILLDDKTAVSIIPRAEYEPGASYFLHITNGITANTGRALAVPVRMTYTVSNPTNEEEI